VLQLKNETPFKAALAVLPNKQGIDTVYTVITATFALWPRLALSDEQVDPVLSDVFFDDSGKSSIRYPSELHLGKPGTDVIVVGCARTVDEKPVVELGVGVHVADQKKLARVLGDRQWTGMGPSRPVPFTEMPLVYERAFGGVLETQGAPTVAEERNPLGKGLAIARRRPLRGDVMPNIEDPRQPLLEGVSASPVGVGCVAPAWLPRRSFAGTFDDTWQQTRAPYLPDDFQLRYFHCASEGLVFDRRLHGGEPIVVVGMSRQGTLRCALPTVKLATTFVLAGQRHTQLNFLQTVLIEPDENRMRLTFHSEFPCDKLVLQVEAVEISLTSLGLAAGSTS
jgi:hypothetical protein